VLTYPKISFGDLRIGVQKERCLNMIFAEERESSWRGISVCMDRCVET